MTREEFLARRPFRFVDADAHFAKLRQPHFEGGKWQLIGRRGPKILDGRFTTMGYLPSGVDPATVELAWEGLDASLGFAEALVARLSDAGCYALESEGDAPYFPFVCPVGVVRGLPDFQVMGAELAPDLQYAYDDVQIQAAYAHYVDVLPAVQRRCVFWPNEHEDDLLETHGAARLAAFRDVSEHMRAELEEPWQIRFHADLREFPVLWGGIDLHDHLVGVITSCVWT